MTYTWPYGPFVVTTYRGYLSMSFPDRSVVTTGPIYLVDRAETGKRNIYGHLWQNLYSSFFGLNNHKQPCNCVQTAIQLCPAIGIHCLSLWPSPAMSLLNILTMALAKFSHRFNPTHWLWQWLSPAMDLLYTLAKSSHKFNPTHWLWLWLSPSMDLLYTLSKSSHRSTPTHWLWLWLSPSMDLL